MKEVEVPTFNRAKAAYDYYLKNHSQKAIFKSERNIYAICDEDDVNARWAWREISFGELTNDSIREQDEEGEFVRYEMLREERHRDQLRWDYEMER